MEHLDCRAFFSFLVDHEAGRLSLNAYAVIPAEEAEGGGLGLLAMHERAASMGGDLNIESVPGMGTCVIVQVPIAT